MCSTFGEASPIEDVVQSIEDIVRTELGEMVLQARAQATRRGARHIVTEDIFFLVRHDRFKLLRLRSFLSWREVRRGIKESQTEDADYNMNITEEPTSGVLSLCDVTGYGELRELCKVQAKKRNS